MSLYIDRKYLQLVSPRLRNFKRQKEDLFNFSCPFCGDSTRNRLKARGYISKSKKHEGYIYTCFNCNVTTGMYNFLKHIDNAAYEEYKLEKFVNDKKGFVVNAPEPEPIELKPEVDYRPYIQDVALQGIPSVAVLRPDHYARQYVESRKIPFTYRFEIFFVEDFKKFMDEVFPTHGKELYEKEPRLVTFFTNDSGLITNVSGRSFDPYTKLRYISIKVSEGKKVFGLFRLSLDEPIYVVEGQFDSFFLPNCIASGDSHLRGLDDWLYDTYEKRGILVFDNQPRNREIVKTISDSVKAGHRVCLLPESFPGKDLNEAVMNGIDVKDIKQIVDANTFQGLEAELQFLSWRKC